MDDSRASHDRRRATPASRSAEDSLRTLGVELGDVIAGKYRVERVLGHGAMGIIVSATHAVLEERVALKLLSPAAVGSSTVARFLREARATVRIRSAHVARVMDVGALEGGVPFIVMEHLDGIDLAAALRIRRSFTAEEAVDYVLQICDALAEAHDLGIVHRDLKPSNLFLAKQRDGSTILKVLDFGVSKASSTAETSDARLTSESAVVGSPHYMSPEQILSPRDVDARADIWSIGVILYELIGGVRPFESSSRDELFRLISVSRHLPLHELRRDVVDLLSRVIDACLEPDLKQRVPDIRDLARRLAPFGGPGASLRVAGIERLIPRVSPPTGAAAELSAPARGRTEDESNHEDSSGASDSLGSWSSSSSGDRAAVCSTLGRRFRLGRVLGQGGMGIVYEAEDDEGGRVAVKVIRPRAARDPVARERLLREAEAAKRVDSVHVARIREVALDGATGAPFIVMDLLEGEDLATLLARAGALTPTAVARIFLQVCRGLEEAHERGLVHRDIKPANIFLHRAGRGRITVKICDFGIAKSLLSDTSDTAAQSLTGTETALGSPRYMSPEQAKNAKYVDTRTDVWSTCVSMYEALAGHHPWPQRTTPGELILTICTEDVPPLHKAAPWVDRRFAEVVHRGLQRALPDRTPSVAELAKAILPLTEGEEELDESIVRAVLPEHRAIVAPGHGLRRSSRIILGGALAVSLVLGAVALPGLRWHGAPGNAPPRIAESSSIPAAPTADLPRIPGPTPTLDLAVRTSTPSASPVASAPASSEVAREAPPATGVRTKLGGTQSAQRPARQVQPTPPQERDAGSWTID